MTPMLRGEWERSLRRRFRQVVWLKRGEPFCPKVGSPTLHPMRHVHVARLYSVIFPRVTEDAVVTLEDDMVPPLDGMRRLVEEMSEANRVGVVAGVYRDRLHPDKICVAFNKQRWLDVPPYDALPQEPFEIGMTGGGFALILNKVLQQVLPVKCAAYPEGYTLGWDGKMCTDFTALGYRILAHPAVMCGHLCPEIAAYDAALRRGA